VPRMVAKEEPYFGVRLALLTYRKLGKNRDSSNRKFGKKEIWQTGNSVKMEI